MRPLTTTERDPKQPKTHQYFRRPNGEIVVGDANHGKSTIEHGKRLGEGWQPLPQRQYPYFSWEPYYADHPFEPLLQFGGGVEFSVQQLVSMGYHLWPPLVPQCGRFISNAHRRHSEDCGLAEAEFPQLDGLDLPGAAVCTFCDEGGSDAKFATQRARDQHVRVMHKDELAQIALGKGIADSIERKLADMGIAAPAYPCGLCKDRFDTADDLVAHIGRHASEMATEAAPPPTRQTRGRAPALVAAGATDDGQ